MSRSKVNLKSKSKLSKIVDEKSEIFIEENLNILQNCIKIFPTSFRLRKIDIERLEDSLKKLNYVNSSHPFKKTDLIRGLIMLANDTESEKLLEYIRKSL